MATTRQAQTAPTLPDGHRWEEYDVLVDEQPHRVGRDIDTGAHYRLTSSGWVAAGQAAS